MVVQRDLFPGGVVKGDVFTLPIYLSGLRDGVTVSSASLEPTSGSAVSASVDDAGADGTALISFAIASGFWSGVTAGTVYNYDIAVTYSNNDVITEMCGTFVAKAAAT